MVAVLSISLDFKRLGLTIINLLLHLNQHMLRNQVKPHPYLSLQCMVEKEGTQHDEVEPHYQIVPPKTIIKQGVKYCKSEPEQTGQASGGESENELVVRQKLL